MKLKEGVLFYHAKKKVESDLKNTWEYLELTD